MAEETVVVTEQTEVAVAEEKKIVAAVDNKAQMLSANPFDSRQSFADYVSMAKFLAGSTMVPKAYQGNTSNCLLALEQAARMNCSPLMIMQQLNPIQGKPVWSGQGCSMIVNGCGLFSDVELVYVGTRGKDDRGAFVRAVRKSTGKVVEGTIVDMAMAKAENWLSNPKWKSMPDQMLGYRAYSFFARLHCPNALSGFATEGEVEDIEASKKNKTVLGGLFEEGE